MRPIQYNPVRVISSSLAKSSNGNIFNSGGMLAGTGSLSSLMVNASEHLSPGDAPGVMTLRGNLALMAGAMMDYQLDTTLDSDKVNMPSGNLALNRQQFSDFDFDPLASFNEATYLLLDADSITGSLGPDTTGTIDGLPASLAIVNNDLVLNVAPEPGTLVLLIAAACGLAVFRLRKRS